MYNQYLEVARKAARAAGEIQLAGLRRILRIETKSSPIDLVTEVDRMCEAEIARQIRESFPTHQLLAEEGTVGGDAPDFRWIVDPLDGTTNYTHRYPFFSVSIALEHQGRLVVGVVLDALHDGGRKRLRIHLQADRQGRRGIDRPRDDLVHAQGIRPLRLVAERLEAERLLPLGEHRRVGDRLGGSGGARAACRQGEGDAQQCGARLDVHGVVFSGSRGSATAVDRSMRLRRIRDAAVGRDIAPGSNLAP